MNRNTEYWDLIRDLNETPAALEGTVDRARAKARRARAGRWLGIPVASLGGVAAAFVLLVNCSTPFAMACGRLPVLRELAAAVALSPSLKAAVENDYIQFIGQTQTKDGVTMTLEYLIADQSQLNLFYTLGSDGEAKLAADPELLTREGGLLEGYGASWGWPGEYDEDDYQLATFHFMEGGLPEELQVRFDVRETGRVKVPVPEDAPAPPAENRGPWSDDDDSLKRAPVSASFTFDLSIDSTLLAPERRVTLDRWVELDGQRLYLEALTIEPSMMEIKFQAAPENTALLDGLDCYVEDGLGNIYGRPSVTYGAGTRLQLESCYFSPNQDLTLYITGARWLDKDRTALTLDLATGRADWLPEGMTVESVERGKEDVYLALRLDGGIRLNWNYYDPEGGQHEWGNYSMAAIDADENGQLQRTVEYRTLRNYPWDTVTIALDANRESLFPQAVEVPLGE